MTDQKIKHTGMKCVQCSECEYFGPRFKDETLEGAFEPGVCGIVVPGWLGAMAYQNPYGFDRRVSPEQGCDLGKKKQ